MICGYHQVDPKTGAKINHCQRQALPGRRRCARHYTSGGYTRLR